jgi:hypothetical protein
MHARICSALLSTLLLACSSNTAGTPFDRPTNDESVPQQGDVADSAPIVADAGHDAARVDAAADSSGDAVAHEAGPLVDAGSDAKDAAPAAWDACELVPAGKTAPTRLGHVWGYYARHLTSRGNKLLFTYSWSTGTSAVAVANTATGVVADLASGSSGSYGLVDTNGKDVVVGDVDGI